MIKAKIFNVIGQMIPRLKWKLRKSVRPDQEKDISSEKKLKQLFPCIMCNLLFQMNDMKDIRFKMIVLTLEMILYFYVFQSTLPNNFDKW